MPNAFLNKTWLYFSKTQFLTQNGLKLRKTLVSNQNIEKSSLKPKGFSSPTVDTKRIFKQEMVIFWQNALLHTKLCQTL